MLRPKYHKLEPYDYAWTVLVTLAVVSVRVWFSLSHPAYSQGDPTAFFPAEAGMQYRWAETVAKTGKLPSIDRRAQWPEGLCMSLDIAPVMEYVAGWAFRLLPWEPDSFFMFAIAFVAILSSLTVAVAYVAVRLLGGSVAGAMYAAFVVGFYPAMIGRVVRNFGRENFALIFVIVPLIVLLVLWRRSAAQWPLGRTLSLIMIGSLSQGLAFASWHMARAIFELHTATILLIALFGGVPRREQKLAALWFLSFAPWWFALPLLQVRSYWLAPNVVALLVIALTLLAARERRHRGVGMVVALVSWLVARHMSTAADDSHVTEVVLAKLHHGFLKPADPALLSPEARLMWIEAFNSPATSELFAQALPAVACGVVLFSLGWRRIVARWRSDAAWRGLIIILLSWLIAYLLFQRLVVLFSFGIAVALGATLSEAVRSRKRLAAVATAFLLLLLIAGHYVDAPLVAQLRAKIAGRARPPATRFENRLADTRDLLQWLKNHTEYDDVIVAWFGLSSQIYAYADRPVVVQSKFENPFIRAKVLRLAEALMGSPALLVEFCRQYQASYVVYEATMVLHHGTESFRYVAGRTRIPTTSSVAMLHFWPHDLSEFRLVYQNRGFRVFKVLDRKATVGESPRYGWFPLYDRQWCGVTEAKGEFDDAALDRAVERATSLENKLLLAQLLAAEGKRSDALHLARLLLAQEPRFWQAAVLMARICAQAGNIEAAKNACRAAEIGYPECPDLPQHIARLETEEVP